jgi:DNA-binding NarL/FixJ family response regulator
MSPSPDRADVPRGTQGNPLLTNREREVLRLICGGFGEREIASELGISIKTVDTYKRNLFKKAGVHKAVMLALWAVRTGRVEA